MHHHIHMVVGSSLITQHNTTAVECADWECCVLMAGAHISSSSSNSSSSLTTIALSLRGCTVQHLPRVVLSVYKSNPAANKLLPVPFPRTGCTSTSNGRFRASAARGHQGCGDGEKWRLSQVLGGSSWTRKLVKFADDNFLPLALVSGLVLGLANPGPGCLADTYHLSKFCTFGTVLISGLTLRSDEIGAAVEAWPVVLVGLASIFCFTPLFSNIIMLLKLQPQEFVTGLAIFSCMPTTVSTGVALTRLAGGNSALALGMSVISNSLGFLIVPFSISKFIASGVGVSIPTEQLFRSLLLTLILPFIMGKVSREVSKGISDFADGNRKLLAVISAIFLSSVPWIQVSRSRSLLLMVQPAIFLVAVMMGALLHASLLAFNMFLIQSLSIVSGGSKSPLAKKENVSALLLVASQKQLSATVAVVEQLGGSLGESGLLVLPCVAAHINQVVIDSFLVSLWRQKEDDVLDKTKVA